MHLQLHGFSVFIDVEKLEAGKFEDKLIQSVMAARNFVLVLSAGALDKCMQDHECKDWVHKVGACLRLCLRWKGRGSPLFLVFCTPRHIRPQANFPAQLGGRSHCPGWGKTSAAASALTTSVFFYLQSRNDLTVLFTCRVVQ